ncbi:MULTISPECIES: hypothetical protein [Roseomonas]|uniref:hypothetical protein n=1 Tax=Roseomonas TaxID=125216 RepID=UPI0028CE0247|nr:hypothetical protein [Roseomonas mucosa]MDT8312731.1 hypothetical protein [Roseomonas mucosa]MDT8351181.1 hypothetical protein [Roseomonas mucosa]MDT8360116.1 hypothetical protein [Roseomonas mucosa]
MSGKDTTFKNHASAPLERPEGKPPVVQGPDGSWMLELARGEDGQCAFVYERGGGIVRVTGQAVLRHPSGHVLQPVTFVGRVDLASFRS